MHDSGDLAADVILDGTNKTVGSAQNVAQPVGILYGIMFLVAGGFFYMLEALVIRRWRTSFTNLYDSKGWTFLDYFEIGSSQRYSLKFPSFFKVFSVLILCLISLQSLSTEIRYDPKLRFYPSLGVLSMKNDNQIFACNIPTIEYLKCAAGTELDAQGNCVVTQEFTPFDLEYKVNNANNCIGTDGTASWRGPLAPFAGGSGIFTKEIVEGINEDTTFGMSCDAQSNFKFKSVPITRSVNLLPLLNHSMIMARTKNQYMVFDMIKGSMGFKNMTEFTSPKSRGDAGFLIRRQGDKLIIVPTSKGKGAVIKVDETYNEFEDKYSVWAMVTGENVTDGNFLQQALANPIDRGKCDSFVQNPTEANNSINITVFPEDGSCHVDGLKEAYLTWYVMEKSND